MELVDMKVQDIELVRKATDTVKLEHVVGNRVVYIGIETQSHGRATDQVSARHRISTCEQGHVMTQPDQFIGEIGDDTFGSTIESGRHALDQRRDLRNFHFFSLHQPMPEERIGWAEVPHRYTCNNCEWCRPPSSLGIANRR